jgi:hypothetical protein
VSVLGFNLLRLIALPITGKAGRPAIRHCQFRRVLRLIPIADPAVILAPRRLAVLEPTGVDLSEL